MSHLIEAADPLDAWQKVSSWLLSRPHHKDFGLLVDVAAPRYPAEAALIQLDDAMAQRRGTLRHVAATIAPRGVVNAADWKAAAERLLLSRSLPKRGSYFRRMVAYEENGHTYNQLDKIIMSLARRGIDPGPVVLEKPTRNGASHRGFPCLSAVQFHRNGDTLHTTALYRSHEYGQKAAGNFLGLASLIDLVSREAELEHGSLSVVSSSAWIDQGSVARVRLALGRLAGQPDLGAEAH